MTATHAHRSDRALTSSSTTVTVDGLELLRVLTERALSASDCAQVVKDSVGGQPQAKAAWIERNLAVDIPADALTISAPVDIIVGDADRVETEAVLRREVVRFVPDARVHDLRGVGHLSPLEAPDEVASIIGGVRLRDTAQGEVGRGQLGDRLAAARRQKARRTPP